MAVVTAMATTPLPRHIVSSSASLQWPLRDPTRSMPPLNYLRPEEMTELRMKSSKASPPQRQNESNSWMDNVPETISTLFTNDEKNDFSQLQYDYTIMSLSILLLGHGYTDEAHALVTPYSWPDEIHISHGPVRYGSSDPGVVSMATYMHSLSHRKEGQNVGEFGMTGWANADYWGNSWRRPFLQREELQELWRGPIMDVKMAILSLVEDHPAGKEWCIQYSPQLLATGSDSILTWDPRYLHRLCAQVTKGSGSASKDLIDFAEKVMEAELHVLLSHCVRLAGYSTFCVNELGCDKQ